MNVPSNLPLWLLPESVQVIRVGAASADPSHAPSVQAPRMTAAAAAHIIVFIFRSSFVVRPGEGRRQGRPSLVARARIA